MVDGPPYSDLESQARCIFLLILFRFDCDLRPCIISLLFTPTSSDDCRTADVRSAGYKRSFTSTHPGSPAAVRESRITVTQEFTYYLFS
jgi:hypothetical protein